MRAPALLAAMLSVSIGACGRDVPRATTTLDPEAFTREFIARLRAADPALRVVREEALRVRVSRPEGTDATSFLDNAYAEYLQNPSGLDDVLTPHVASASDLTRRDDDGIDLARVVPVVKDVDYLTEVGASRHSKPTDDLHREPLNDRLVVVYAEDSPHSLRFLMPEHVKGFGLPPNELRRRAVENLSRILPKVEIHDFKDSYMVTAGGTFESSLLLLDDFWTRERFDVEGDFVAAIPARHSLLVTGTEETDALRRARRWAAKIAREDPYRLTADLFVRRDGRWEPFDR